MHVDWLFGRWCHRRSLSNNNKAQVKAVEHLKNWNRRSHHHYWQHKRKVHSWIYLIKYVATCSSKKYVCITVNTILVEPTSTESLASNQSKTGAQSSSMEATKAELSKIASRLGTCRVCLKSFQPDDFSKICMECNQKVCEDCASYSKYEDNDDNTVSFRWNRTWLKSSKLTK